MNPTLRAVLKTLIGLVIMATFPFWFPVLVVGAIVYGLFWVAYTIGNDIFGESDPRPEGM